ncbi:MAG: thioredoxin family protein [Kiritimatiellia bacterium]|nr:thioredoxin family protein [Kiritimatiellia bacterium]
MKSGGEKCLLYDKFTVFSTDGDTVSHVEVGGGEVTGRARSPRRRVAPTRATASQASTIRKIADGGQRIDLKKIIVPGKITVVDFYADWCGPCKRMGPQLEQLARSDPDVVLCKVDIVNWNKPVVKQFGIRSIPNVRVYDRNGAAVGTPTSGLGAIKQNIERAR